MREILLGKIQIYFPPCSCCLTRDEKSSTGMSAHSEEVFPEKREPTSSCKYLQRRQPLSVVHQ